MLLTDILFSYRATALSLLPKISRRLDSTMSPNELATELGPFMSDQILTY